MKVKDIMTYSVEGVLSSDTVFQAAEKMKEKNVGVMPVFEQKKPIGMITDRDIVIRVIAEKRDPFSTNVTDSMTHEIIFCLEDMDIKRAAEIMEYKQIRRLLVENHDHQAVGIISLGDIAMSEPNELSGEVLREVSGVAHPER